MDLPADGLDSELKIKPSSLILVAFIFGSLLTTSLFSYLLFHSLVETIISVVAFSVFIIAWTARMYMENNYLVVLGVANLFVGLIGIVHLLAYKGMGIFPGYSSNLPTQLWIFSRYIVAGSLIAAPLLMSRKLNWNLVFAAFALITSVGLAAIFLGYFPTAYVDGSGLTRFKIWSEYLISALFVVSILLLYRRRNEFPVSIFDLLVASTAFTIAGELLFTLYTDPYGLTNMLGHLAILASFLLIFGAIVRTGIVRPYDMIFRSLKKSEISLRSERDFAEAIITNAQAIVLVVGPDGRILRVNPFMEEVSGWRQDELIFKDWAEALVPCDEKGVGKNVVSDLLHSSGKAAFSGKILTRGGEAREVEWRLKLLERGSDGPEGILFIGHDVTDERRLERALSERAGELARSNSELNQFAYVASHDLQEPLRMVISYLGLLERKYSDKLDGDAKMYMKYAVDGSKRMKELINDLLAYSRVGSGGGEFTEVDMNEALSTALTNLGQSIEANHARIEAERLFTITADRTQMVQLLQNLVGNAIKYRSKDDPTVLIGCSEDPVYWTFSVKDNGIGIDPAQHERIFQMFQRLHTREEYDGTGIGLAIAKRIVERHGGSIWVESADGAGSEFFFTIKKDAGNSSRHSPAT
jgi:PAS domain S-box-containing protein